MANVTFPTASQARQTARNYTAIFQEVNSIETAILESISNNSYQAIVKDNTPMTSTSGIKSVNVVNGGTGYQPIEAYATVSHPTGVNAEVDITLTGGSITGVTVTNGGTGYTPIEATVSSVTRISNANATITLAEVGGAVTGYSIVSAGQGYHVNDAINIIDSGGPGVNATAVVSSIGDLGEILTVSIVNPGSGYVTPVVDSIVRITPSNASLTPVVTNGAISSVTVNSGGTAYHIGDEIIISHPSGVGASVQVGTIDANGSILTALVVIGGSGYDTVNASIVIHHPIGVGFSSSVQQTGGVITSVTVDDVGAGYSPVLPSITVTDSTGTGATFNVTVSGGVVTSVDVINKGSNYSQNATAVVVPAPTSSGHDAEISLSMEGYTTGVSYYNVYKGITTSRELSDQIQFVLDYFTNLGYNIKLQTNPSTLTTLQWYIVW